MKKSYILLSIFNLPSQATAAMVTFNHQMKKIIAALLLSLVITTSLVAQDWLKNLPQDKVQTGNLTFFDYQKAFYDYWNDSTRIMENKEYEGEGEEGYEGTGYEQFKRWEWYWEVRVDPLTGEFPKTSAYEEFQKYLKNNPGSSKSTAGNWTSVGPTSSPGGYAGLGRINCVAFHPSDNNVIYAGAASGGLWKTNNGGASWTILSDAWPVQGCTDICIVSGTPNTIYAATGDRENTMWHFGGGQNHDNNSVGVWVSTDAGASWGSTGLSFIPSQKIAINRLLIDPTNSNILYAATTNGVYKTTDAGANWSQIYATQFSDMEFQPGTPTTIYGSSMAGDIYRTINSGSTWTATLTTTFGRVEMAVTPANPNIVYAVMQDLPSPVDESPVYKSTDGGASFFRIFNSSTISLFGYQCDGSDIGNSQASYDLCIAADPNNANIVIVGGINVWKSTDGGVNWNIATHWSSTCSSTVTIVHADQHYLAYQPISNHLFLGNDGGLYKSANNGTSWSYIGSGLVTTQIYRIGVAQSTSNEFMLGAQDNGTKAFLSGSWKDVIGGDGGYCFIDYSNQNYLFGEYVLGDISRSLDHGVTWTHISSGLSGSAAFISPFVIDPNVHTTIYVGYQDVWKSTDQGDSWTKISNWAGSTLRHIAVAPSNSQTIYATTQSILYRTTDGGTTWSNITGTLPVGSSLITYFSVKNDDPNTVWVSMGNYTANRIYQTTDGGATWTSISAGLPSVPVMCVIQNKQNTSRVDLYAATDVGVYVKAGTADWQLFSSGLPTTLANELDIYYDANPGNSKIYAGTYGRGLWRSDLYESGVLNPTNVEAIAGNDTQIDLSWALASGNNVLLAFNTTSTFGTPVDGTAYTTTIPGGGTVLYNGSNSTYSHTSLNPNTTYYYKIWSYDGSINYSSGITANTSTFCTLITSFPWIEGFENGGAIPNCWTQEYVSGSNNWEMQVEGTNHHPANAHTGTYLARNRTTSVNAGYISKFVSPAIDLTQISDPFLSFWHTQDFWASQDELRVYYKTSVGGAWNLLATYTNSIASWTRESILLPNATSAYFIAFESTVNAGYGVCIDDIMVSTSIADFVADASLSCTGSLTVNFTDNSIGPNGSWAWDVDNDGTTDYTTQNPTHTYSSPGIYSVKLTVNNGVSSTTKENLILIMNGEPTVGTGCVLTSNSNNGNGFGIGIYRFALGSIDYTTSNNDGYYQNYTCSKWTSLELNKSYDITIQTGTSNNEGARVYIDYNDNGIFDAGESVASFPSNKDGTRTLSFTTPSSGVMLDKGIRLRVLSKFGGIPGTGCDISSYGQAEDYTVFIVSDATWSGTTSTDWATSGNWNINSVPVSGAKIKIPSGAPYYPVITSNVTCKDLMIMSGASLTINPVKDLTVSGVLTNNAGNAGLIIKSDATGTGSLIENSGVNATVERYLTQDAWHYVSPPVDDPPASVFLGIYMIKWDEPSGLWTYITDPNYVLATDMEGYGIWSASGLTGNTTVTFTGSLNSGPKVINVTNTAGPPTENDGYNFAGNPYPSSLDWNVDDGSGWSRTAGNVDLSLYIWNQIAGNYGVYVKDGGSGTNGVDNIIPPQQGFFIHCSAATGSLGVNNGARIHAAKDILKTGENSTDLLKLRVAGNNYADEILVEINSLSLVNLDPFDALKLNGSGAAPQFYSLTKDDQKLSINSFPETDDYKVIPVGVDVGLPGSYTLSVSELEGFSASGNLYLEDLLTHTFTKLDQNSIYSFLSSPLDEPVRFLLHLNGQMAVPENFAAVNGIRIYSFNHDVYITSESNLNGIVRIYDLVGKEVKIEKLTDITINKINLTTPSGYYIVKVQSDKGNMNQKVFIK